GQKARHRPRIHDQRAVSCVGCGLLDQLECLNVFSGNALGGGDRNGVDAWVMTLKNVVAKPGDPMALVSKSCDVSSGSTSVAAVRHDGLEKPGNLLDYT